MVAWAGAVMLGALVLADDSDNLLARAETALKNGLMNEALALASKAVEAEPKNAKAHFVRGVVYDQLGKYPSAIADFTRALELDAKFAEAYDRRGSTYFKSAKIKESLADFDRFLELSPQEQAGHWRRGIALYYAGRFDEGRKQFEAYEKVDNNDVENAVWQFLCAARVAGVEKARAGLLKIGHDRRIPMMKVYALFAGKAKPEEVMAAAHAGKPPEKDLTLRLFYSHLYLGLYYEALGETKPAREHITKAAKDYYVAGYMGDVARVTCLLLDSARSGGKPRPESSKGVVSGKHALRRLRACHSQSRFQPAAFPAQKAERVFHLVAGDHFVAARNPLYDFVPFRGGRVLQNHHDQLGRVALQVVHDARSLFVRQRRIESAPGPEHPRSRASDRVQIELRVEPP